MTSAGRPTREIVELRTPIRAFLLTLVVLVVGVAGIPPARADVDTDFAEELHQYGIYGPRDYNAWLGKITCERLTLGPEHNAIDSAKFLSANLPRGTTAPQAWQFLTAALGTYCPEQLPTLSAAAETAHPRPRSGQ
jgi:hypothetical protein